MQERLENGLVVRVTGGEVWVRVAGETVACSQRGRSRVRESALSVVAGDRVTVLRESAGVGSLEEVLPRTSWLSRYIEREASERVVVANIERLFVVVAAVDPPLHPGFLDRVLAAAEWGHIPPCIIFNKMDLARPGQFDALRATYAPSLYELIETCAIKGRGIDEISARIGDGVYAFVGESGVGKSSILNRLDPELDLVVDELSERTGRGRHTTTNSQLFPFRDGFLADTPGMQTFGFPGTDEYAVVNCFPEIRHIEGPCRFNPCSHSHEPGCRVKAAVEAGRIPPTRYQSYLDILSGVREVQKKRNGERMGRVKTIERSGKRGLMRAVGWLLRAPRMTPDEFRAQRFERILVVRQHNQMGDMMLATPALRAIRETYPHATIGIVTSTLNRGVLANSPFVDHVFTYDKRRPGSHLAMLRALRRDHFDLAIVLHTVSFSFTTLMLGVMSGARVRIGSTSARIGDALTGSYLNVTLPLPTPAQLVSLNEAEHNLFPLRYVGITTDDLAPLIVPGEASERWADGFAGKSWRDGTMKIAVHPGAGKVENIWKPENFAAVVNLLGRARELSLVVVQGPADAATVEAFTKACDVQGTIVKDRSIGDVAALLKRADLVLCNDTGVMHVACAAGARVLAIFGLTDPVRWAPRSPGLRIVRAPGGDLRALEPATVAREAEDYLRVSNASSV